MTAASEDTAEVLRWRQALRQRLLAERAAVPADERRRRAAAMAARIDRALGERIGTLQGRIVAVYWPIRHEPNLRDWMQELETHGATCALPVVVERAAPLVFRSWRPGEALERGVWGIPVPAGGRVVAPDVVIAPVVGFDDARYRLGNGGGYYDRTLAALAQRPLVIGIGPAPARVPTIHPLPHDVPVDLVVTEVAAL